MGPPRVLINCMSLWQGGSSRNYYGNILRELDRDPRGFEFTVLAPAGELSAEILGRNKLFEVQLPDRFRTSTRVVYELAVLPFRARGFDLVYCTADLLPIWSPAPVVVAFRNFNIYDRRFYNNARTRIFFQLVRWKVGRAAAIVTPSRSAAAGISMALGVPEERFSVVPHGVSPEAFDDGVMPAPHDRPYLIYPANLERHKNFETLFEAMGELSESGPGLWIAGSDRLEPGYGDSLRGMVRELGLEDRVKFVGNVPYREVLGYYRGAAALIFPTWLETFGHPLLEAMLAGTPIIASDIPTCREVAGDAATYFPPGDAKAMAQAIEAVLANPQAARRRVEAGRGRAAEYTWKRSLDRLCQVFRDVLKEEARP